MKSFKEILEEKTEYNTDIFFKEVFGKVFDWAMVDFYSGPPLIQQKGFFKLIYDPEYHGNYRSDVRLMIFFDEKAKQDKIDALKNKIRKCRVVESLEDVSGMSGYSGWSLNPKTTNFVVYLKPTKNLK